MAGSPQFKTFGIIWGVIIVLLLIGAYITFNPGTTGIDITENGSDIEFTASRRWVINQGDCVTLTWQLDRINAVYIDDAGQVGFGTSELCVNGNFRTTTMEVEHQDGTVSEYTLTIGTMVNAPEIWILSLLIIALVLTSFIVLISKWLKNMQPVLRPVLRWTVILGLNLLVVIIVGEIGLRLYFQNYGTEGDRGRYIYSLEELRDRSRLSVLPFLNYAISTSEANNLGYRDVEDTVVPKPDGVYRIVAIGGSTTYGLGISKRGTYPTRLQEILRDQYGYTNVEVLNAGAPGYLSWNSLVNLAFRVLEVEPDLIIIYHGVNDVRARIVDPECYRGENIHRGLYTGAGVLQLRGQFVSPSTLHRFIGINAGWMEDPLVLENNIETVISCPEPTLEREELVQINQPVYFERNLISMIGIARIHEIDVMLSTWTYNAVIPEDVGPEWWKIGVAGNNEVIRNVAAEYDTLFFDLDATDMSDNPEYWFGDFTHQSREGVVFQAQLYAEYLDSQNVIPQP